MRIDTYQARASAYKELLATITPGVAGEMYEKLTAGIYSRVLRHGDVSLDGGANAGRHTIGMANAVGPNGHVFAFEPSTAALPILKRNLAEAGVAQWVTLHEVALGESEGSASFCVLHGALGMSGLQLRELDDQLKAKVRVENIVVRVTKLDSLIPSTTPVRFIKLDVEGGEYHAMVGGVGLISAQRPVIVFENGRGHSAADYKYTEDDFFGFFDSVNYSLYDALGFPFTRDQWTMGSVPWQYIALPKESGPHLQLVFDEIRPQLQAHALRTSD